MKINFKPTLLFFTICLMCLTVIAALTLQFYFSKDLAQKAIETNVETLSLSLKKELAKFDDSSSKLLYLFEMNEEFKTFPENEYKNILLKTMTKALSLEEYNYSIYVGYHDDSFYEVINLGIDERLGKIYETKKDEKWLVVSIKYIGGKRVLKYLFLNEKLDLLREEKSTSHYRPKERPWYIKAVNEQKIIKTKPYMFSILQKMGITYAKEIDSTNNVLGIDYSLDSLSNFLKNQKFVEGTKLILYDDKSDEIIATNKTSDIDESLVKRIKSTIKNSIFINNVEYILVRTKIGATHSDEEMLITLIPQEKMMETYLDKIYSSLLYTFLIILFMIPVIWYFSELIVRPINALEHENEKIKHRRFKEVKEVKTSIRELSELSKSLIDMSKSIDAYQKRQIDFIDSVVNLIATTIDEKSKYTAGHCQKVPILTMMLTKAANDSDEQPFKDFKLSSEDELRELNTASLLHDCGKVTTPEYIVDKATKLETIYNRIHEIRTRFEVLHRDLIIESYEKILNGEDEKSVKEWLSSEHQKLQDEFSFIADMNVGDKFTDDESKKRIEEIAKHEWTRNFDNTIGLSHIELERLPKENPKVEKLLDNKPEHIIERYDDFHETYKEYGFNVKVPEYLYNLGEIYNLQIEKGTLSEEDRFKINEHIIVTIKMLENLPLPENLDRIPEYAGGHHERLDGKGYPRGLTKDKMSIPARIMAIADVFEALTASDRPYKVAKKLSESIKILSFMVKDNHLDKDLFKLFLSSGVYKTYANKHLKKNQNDEVNIKKYLEEL